MPPEEQQRKTRYLRSSSSSRSHTLYGNELWKALPSIVLEAEPLDSIPSLRLGTRYIKKFKTQNLKCKTVT